MLECSTFLFQSFVKTQKGILVLPGHSASLCDCMGHSLEESAHNPQHLEAQAKQIWAQH